MQMDLYNEISSLRKKLDKCVKLLRENGTRLAEAERAYKVSLRKHALILKTQGMAIGMINLTVYGIEEVANLRFERDVAQYSYDANKDAVNSTKLQLRLVEAQLSREWSQAGEGI